MGTIALTSCTCNTKAITAIHDLCVRHKLGYLNFEQACSAENNGHLSPAEWVKHRLQAEIEHPVFYAEFDNRLASEQNPEQIECLKKMTTGLISAVLVIDQLLGPNWFRADPDHVAAVQACLDGLDAQQVLTPAELSHPKKRALNLLPQRVKLEGYLGDSITNVCGCADVIEDGHQLCHFHRQHYFAYRQRANPATMLRVQEWSVKRKSAIDVWATSGGLR